MNEPSSTWVRMYMNGGKVGALAIMTDNDILQTKYVTYITNSIALSSSSISDSLHIVIENVTKNMGATYNDAILSYNERTNVYINDISDSEARGTWTSSIEPENATIELDCKVVDNSTNTIIAKCDSETTWPESVFNRLPIWVDDTAVFGHMIHITYVLFDKSELSFDGSIPSGWNRYDVTTNKDGTSLILGNQFTIKNLPTDFVSHWANMNANAMIGMYKDSSYKCAILVPPE